MLVHKVAGAGLLVLLCAAAALHGQTPPGFFARHTSGKCLDVGAPPQVPGAPVFLYECNGTVAQEIQIQEINGRHDVKLRAGGLVIGVRDIPPDTGGRSMLSANAVAPVDMPLELQGEAKLAVQAARQIFALDGDSILLAANRSLVVKAPRQHWTNRTPLVLGERDLTDAEFWAFRATDGTTPTLTRGFVRVPQDKDFATALHEATWGTVIDVDPNTLIEVHAKTDPYTPGDDLPLPVPAGVTIRGGRSGVHRGAEISLPYPSVDNTSILQLLSVTGSDVRITGLRLRGPSSGRSQTLREAQAINTDSAINTLVDHNELSEWPGAAVVVTGGNDAI